MSRRNKVLRGLPYYGGKSPITAKCKWISGIIGFDPKKSYVEPFAGMLGVLLSRPAVRIEVANDLNGDVVNWWRVVRDNPKELADKIDHTPWSRELYYESKQVLRDGVWLDDVDRAHRFHAMVEQGVAHASGHDSGTGWSCAYNPTKGSKGKWRGDRFAPLAERLFYVQLENRPAEWLLERVKGVSTSVVYCDPPYHGSASTTPYGNQPFDKDAISGLLLQCKGRVAVSGYNDDWNHLGWVRHEHRTTHTSMSSKRGIAKTEVLWANF